MNSTLRLLLVRLRLRFLFVVPLILIFVLLLFLLQCVPTIVRPPLDIVCVLIQRGLLHLLATASATRSSSIAILLALFLLIILLLALRGLVCRLSLLLVIRCLRLALRSSVRLAVFHFADL